MRNILLILGFLFVAFTKIMAQQNIEDYTWEKMVDFKQSEILFLFDDQSIIYAGVSNYGLAISRDEGKTWLKLEIPNGPLFPSSLSKVQGNYFLTSFDKGIFYSMDGSKFEDMNFDLEISLLYASAVHLGDIYVAGHGGVYVLKNNSSTWTKESLPANYRAETLFQLEASSELMIAGGTNKVFIKKSGIDGWECADFDFRWDIRNLNIFNNAVIWVGTTGGGIYVSEDEGLTWYEDEQDIAEGNVIFMSKAQPDKITTISGKGIYQSVDDLNRINSPGFKNIEKHRDHYYAGTVDQGIYRLQLLPPPPPSTLLSILPNPSAGYFDLLLENADPDKEYSILFFDSSGRMFKRVVMPGQIRLSSGHIFLDLPPGIYNYNLLDKNSIIEAGRLVISR